MARPLTDGKLSDQYIQSVFATELPTQEKIRLESIEGNVHHMQVSPIEGGLLHFFVRLVNARKVVEIGSLLGYSSSWILRALPSDGEIHCFERSAKFAAKIVENLTLIEKEIGKPGAKFMVHQGEALKKLAAIESSGPFDIVFIDADKGNYANYLTWAESNVRRGGLVIGDNTFLFGQVYVSEQESTESKTRWQAMREFNARLADRSRYNSMLIPTVEGLTVAQRL